MVRETYEHYLNRKLNSDRALNIIKNLKQNTYIFNLFDVFERELNKEHIEEWEDF